MVNMLALADVCRARRMDHRLNEKDAVRAQTPGHKRAKTASYVFEAVRMIKIVTQRVAFLPTLGQNRLKSRAFLN